MNQAASADEMLVACRESLAALRSIASRTSIRREDELAIRDVAAAFDEIALWLSSRAIAEAAARKRGAP